MDARKELLGMRQLFAAAYAKHDVQSPRCAKSSGIPGLLFDAAVVCAFALLAVHYVFTA